MDQNKSSLQPSILIALVSIFFEFAIVGQAAARKKNEMKLIDLELVTREMTAAILIKMS